MVSRERREQMAIAVYWRRRDRLTHPEGRFDRKGCWYPSEREDAAGDCQRIRCPTRAHPYSYMLHCRTLKHCRALVERLLDGNEVPEDVLDALWLYSPFPRDKERGIVRDWFMDGCPVI